MSFAIGRVCDYCNWVGNLESCVTFFPCVSISLQKMDHQDVELMVLLEQETVTLVMELETEVMMTGDPVVVGGMGMVWLEVEIL